MTQNGTAIAHGREVPLYEHPSYNVEVMGTIPEESAEALKAELLAIGTRYGLTFKVRPTVRLSPSAEDRAEMLRLDEQSI